MQRWFLRIGWMVLVWVLIGCGRLDPPPIMHPVQGSTTTPAGFTLTLASPLSCLAVGREATFDLTITNPHDAPRMLDPGTLEMRITGRSDTGVQRDDRWSASADYPTSMRRVFGAGEVRHYAWHWPVEALGDVRVSVDLSPSAPQDTAPPRPTHVEFPVAIGSITQIVGGYAGTFDHSCDAILQSTEQTAISLSGGDE